MDNTVGAGTPPLEPGQHAGYWFELRDAKDHVLFTQSVRDPAVVEGPGQNVGFVNFVRPWCDDKVFELWLPNDVRAKAIVFFGSPYGRGIEGTSASELARFRLP